MTLTEKIQSLTDLELAELWDLNHVFEPRTREKTGLANKLFELYDLSDHVFFTNQKKEIMEAMRAEIIKRYLNQNKLTLCDNCGEESERISTGSICSKCYC